LAVKWWGIDPGCSIGGKSSPIASHPAYGPAGAPLELLASVDSQTAIDENELRVAGFTTELFRNLNTPEDLADAVEMTSPVGADDGAIACWMMNRGTLFVT
jgi:hypothetical protein